MNEQTKTSIVLASVAGLFTAIAISFLTGFWHSDRADLIIVMTDPAFIDKAPVRMNYTALLAADEDTSDYDCYACHSRREPVELNFDELGRLLIVEHDYITFAHGPALENKHCFNCHDQNNMDHLRTQYGRLLTFHESTVMCGSCHGTTYRDWKAGAHGKTLGYWNLEMGERRLLDCTECHDPHHTAFPSIEPAPGPHSMRGRFVVEEVSD